MKTLELNAPAVDKRYDNTCFALFVLGGMVGAAQLSAPVPFGSGFEMVAIARNLAANGSFANPFLVMNTGPTAANPPLYPLFLAVLIKVFRIPALILAMACVGNIVMNALTASLLPRISRLFFGDMLPGAAAAVLWLASVQLMPDWDVSYTVAGLLVFCLWTASSSEKATRRLAKSLLKGCLAGLLFLANPSSVLITAPWIAYLLLRRKMVLREAAVLFVALFVIGFVWMARNRRELGSFVDRTNLGMTLYASNNDCAQSSMFADEANNCYQSHHPNTSLPEAQLLYSLGEVKYDHKRLIDTEIWIKAHPRRFSILSAERFRDFWFPPMDKKPYTACAIWLVTALSIPGLILTIRRRNSMIPFVLIVLLLYPLMYYVVVSDVRYRYPVLWLSLLPAGYWIQTFIPQKIQRLMAARSATCDLPLIS